MLGARAKYAAHRTTTITPPVTRPPAATYAMLFIDNRGITDPRVNLALEEYCLLNADISERYLLFYVNEPAVIIGKHQNTIEEIDPDFIRDRAIHVVRRISGGGAVYHDQGNLNFSFITRYAPEHFNNYRMFTEPLVRALRALGVPAEMSGRNDLVAGGRKISGNAQVVRGERMFSHGTLLFDSNLDDVTRALRPKAGKVESKGIQSIRSRVANISEFLAEPLSVDAFRRHLLEHIFPGTATPPTLELTPTDWARVHELANTKYATWEWNYGHSPAFNLRRAKRFPIGEVDVLLDVHDGMIRGVRFFGDFFAQRDISDLELALLGTRYAPAELEAALTEADVSSYLAGVTNRDLLKLIY
jgi:lipoate-protein ligase A